MPTKKPMTTTANGGASPNAWNDGPQHRDVEAPVGDRADQRRVARRARAAARSRMPDEIAAGTLASLLRRPGEPRRGCAA